MAPALLPLLWLVGTALPVAWPFAPVEKAVLDNGLTVLVAPDSSSPLVSVAVMYTVGARNEAAGVTGLAHYVEHMNFRATRRFPGTEITDAITRIGGRWNGYTWIDQTYYAETAHRDAFDRMLDLERDRMADALFDPADFAKERTSVIAELHSYDDPRSLLYDAVLAASFEIHPYRHNTIGWLTDVEAVTRDEAYRFYRRFYHPNNAVLVVVGDVAAADAIAKVRARFASLPGAGESTRVRTVEPPQRGERRVVVRRPGPHARVLAAFRAPALADPDFPVLVLFDALLAGGKGLRFTRDYPKDDTAVLHRAVASVTPEATGHSQWQAARDPYVYTLGADVPDAGTLPAAEEALFRAAREAASREWTDEEIARALRQVVTGWASDLDDKAGRAHQLAFFEVSGGYEFLLGLPARLARVTRDDVRRFAAARLTREQATVGWFVPADAERTLASAVASAANGPGDVAGAATEAPAVPAYAPGTSPTAAPPLRLRLGNGATAVVAPAAGGALVTLRGRIEAGAMFDGGTPGLSALATELLARPVPGEPPGAAALSWTLHEEPDSPAAGRWIEFSASALAGDLPDVLRDLAARLRRALAFAGGGSLEPRNGTPSGRRLPIVRGPTRPPRPPACGSRRFRRCTRRRRRCAAPPGASPGRSKRPHRRRCAPSCAATCARARSPSWWRAEWTRRPRGARSRSTSGRSAARPRRGPPLPPSTPLAVEPPGGSCGCRGPARRRTTSASSCPGIAPAPGTAPRPSCCCTCSARPGTRAGWARRSWIPGSCTPSTRRGRRKGPRGS